MTNKITLSGLIIILSALALGILFEGCTSLDRDTQAAKLFVDSFVSKTYENATASYNNNDFLTAIYQYREVLKIRPNHSDSKTYLKLAWDKLLEENKDLYPSPFEGQYAFSRKAEVVPSHVIAFSIISTELKEVYYVDLNGKRIPPYYVNVEKEVPSYVTIPEYTIPAANFLYIFNDKTYTFIADENGRRTQKEGTFYYNGNNLELDDGTILIHSDNVLRDQQNRGFTRKQEYTDNEK